MKLKFGDLESIKYAKSFNLKAIEKKLSRKVKCYYCRAPVAHCFTRDEKQFGWNFKCRPSCKNSFKKSVEGEQNTKLYTDHNGKFI